MLVKSMKYLMPSVTEKAHQSSGCLKAILAQILFRSAPVMSIKSYNLLYVMNLHEMFAFILLIFNIANMVKPQDILLRESDSDSDSDSALFNFTVLVLPTDIRVF